MARIYSYPSSKRRRSSRRVLAWILGVSAVLGVIVWWAYRGDAREIVTAQAEEGQSLHLAEAESTVTREVRPAKPDDPVERGAPGVVVARATSPKSAKKIQESTQAAKEALAKDDVLSAQVQLSAALRAGAAGDQAAEIRAKLVQLANKVIFEPGRVSGDPRTSSYVVRRGDNLRKIAKQYKITDDLIARVNKLADKSMIRAGARLKVVNGPFHALVDKSDHRLDVYLDDVLVRTYRVGLGEHGSTPTGTWRVKNKLKNPTYFPPRGGKIVHAEDPNNPLGEHWLGLEGVAGEAKDQLRYGIHGTNEPESIGKDASLGCIRLHNKDVAELYSLLVTKDSQVMITD